MRLFILVALALAVSGTIANSALNRSPFAAKLAKELSSNSSKQDNYLSSNINISAILKFNKQFDFLKAKSIGIKFPTITGNIATAQIPSAKYLEFLNFGGIDYIEIAMFSAPAMDSAKSSAHIQEIIDGIDLPQAYHGENVVVGIIDAGFDYTHPAFYDTQNDKLIISRVWEQGKPGTPPVGFDYGSELSTQEAILSAEKDIENFSHGTHVAGIAVGQPVEGAIQFQGIATKSELVIVALKPPSQEQWKNTSGSDIIDGVNYIFKYAESIGKPAVVNLSWGGQIGPHDGTSLFSQAIDNLVGEGKIFVCSAGNDGAIGLHVNKTLTPNDSLLVTYAYNDYASATPQNGIWLDVWGDEGKPFEFRFNIVDQITLESKYATEFLSTTKDTIFEYIYRAGKDSCNLMIYVNTCPYNNKPHAFVNMEGNKTFWGKITAKAKEGTIHAWNWYLIDYSGIEKQFWAKNDPQAINGNNSTTISDFASSKRAISVGALISKNKYTNINNATKTLGGKIGDLAPFSSLGPSADNRVKPDIVAPGMGLAASVSSFDSSYLTGGAGLGSVVFNYALDVKTYPYAVLSGTSMSSPTASGAIALLLSAQPKLTPEQVIELLRATATQDSLTTQLPNIKWGNGKLHSHNAIKRLLGIGEVNEFTQSAINIFPNPFTNYFSINQIEPIENAEIKLYNSLGECLISQKYDFGNTKLENLSNLPNGVYFISIINNDGKILHQSSVVKY